MSSPKAVKRRKGDLREAKKEVFLEGRVFVRYFSSNVQRQVRYLVKLVQGMGSERLYSYPHSAPQNPSPPYCFVESQKSLERLCDREHFFFSMEASWLTLLQTPKILPGSR